MPDRKIDRAPASRRYAWGTTFLKNIAQQQFICVENNRAMISLDQLQITFCVKKGSYLVCINVASFLTDKTATFLSYFSVS